MESSRYLRKMYPCVRTVKNHVGFSPEKYNYMCIFRGVRITIRKFIKLIFPSELYPRDRTIREQYLYNWRYNIFDRFENYISIYFIGLSDAENACMKPICKIGFTLWFGFGWRFPKHLTRSKFRHQLCAPFIDIARTACDNMLYLTDTEHRNNEKIIKYYMHKIIYILSYEIV